MWRRVLSFLAGLAIGAVLWSVAAAAYNRPLAAITEPLLRIDPRYRDAEVSARERLIVVQSPEKAFPSAEIPAAELTYTVALLIALFASNRKPWRDRNVGRFLLASLIIAALHPVGLLVTIESTYAARFGSWGEQHYSTAAAQLWLAAEMFWRLVGMFGAVFAVWWILSMPDEVPENRDRTS